MNYEVTLEYLWFKIVQNIIPRETVVYVLNA